MGGRSSRQVEDALAAGGVVLEVCVCRRGQKMWNMFLLLCTPHTQKRRRSTCTAFLNTTRYGTISHHTNTYILMQLDRCELKAIPNKIVLQFPHLHVRISVISHYSHTHITSLHTNIHTSHHY